MLAAPAVRILLAGTLLGGCLPGAFDDLDRGQAGVDRDAAVDAGSDAPAEDGAVEDAAADAGEPELDAGPETLSISLTDDRDDGIFCIISGDLDEKLHFSPDEGAAGFTIEVGVDSEQCRTGLRFELPLEPGAVVESALLTLRRVGPDDNVTPSATMRVQVYQSDWVEAFDDSHQHDTFAQHGAGGLWTTLIGGWTVGPSNAFTESPELASLVQHVIDGAAWQPNRAVTFLISPDAMTDNEYAQFFDSSAGQDPPRLTLRFRP